MQKREYRLRLTKAEHDAIRNLRGIKDAANASGIDIEDVKHGWIKDNNFSVFFKNPAFGRPSFDESEINIDNILKLVPRIDVPEHISADNQVFGHKFDRVVYTDAHIGMEPNVGGHSQYGGVWDEYEVNIRMWQMINFILRNKKSDTLVIDDLGDFMDGWNAKTVRRQHDLPQNMDDQKAFDVALNFKWNLFINLAGSYRSIIFNNICNDNHAGAFGYVVNSAFKKMVEATGRDYVTVTNHRKFINHYIMGKNTFIITHGKDGENLKFGFKPKLDAVQIEKISNYIDHEWLMRKDCRIELSKGDSHQFLLDMSTSDKFEYFNFPAFSPSSNWVQTNYKKGKSGFVMFNYHGTEYSILPSYFAWQE